MEGMEHDTSHDEDSYDIGDIGHATKKSIEEMTNGERCRLVRNCVIIHDLAVCVMYSHSEPISFLGT